jgi:hypothetical protein
MFRLVAAVVAVALLALPSILIAARSPLPAGARLLLSAFSFLSPLVMIWAIHLVPALNGEAPDHSAFWRGVGILLSASTLIVPWLIYAAVRDRSGR